MSVSGLIPRSLPAISFHGAEWPLLWRLAITVAEGANDPDTQRRFYPMHTTPRNGKRD